MRAMSASQSLLQSASTATAHDLAAALARAGAEPPASEVIGLAKMGGMRIVVSITKDEPARLYLNELGKKILGDIGDPAPVMPEPHRPPVHACILEAAPRFTEKPVTMRRLASLAGYSYSPYFRTAVGHLVDGGELVRNGRGVRRRAAK